MTDKIFNATIKTGETFKKINNMNESQNKKNAIIDWRCALAAMVVIFIISGAILTYLWNKKEEKVIVSPTNSPTPTTPTVSVSPSPTPSLTPTVTPPQEVWQTFTSSELSFSMKYPQMVYGANRCALNDHFWVPLKIFEDKKNRATYITEEYYYDNWSDKLQSNTGPCKKITYSLESLQNEKEKAQEGEFSLWWKPFLGWAISTSDIKNENELNLFIKNNYGEGCLIKNKINWIQNGVFEINLEEKNLKNEGIDTACPLNYSYKILYSPKKNKIASIKLGQECSFYTDPDSSSYKCYDEEIINSFIFN